MSFDIAKTVSASLLLTSVSRTGMQDFSRLVHICHYALESQAVDGAIVEFGCFNGETAKLLSVITDKEVFLFDSFEGLPKDAEKEPGAMRTYEAAVIANFVQNGIRLPRIKKGWFSAISPSDLPEKIAFAHLDGDLYSSTIESLLIAYGRMATGGIMLIDDYGDPYWTGPKQACDQFFYDKPEKVTPLRGMNGLMSYKGVVIKH